uniref:Integrase catalytic domain-containing protein n=1 Tax=Amphimedon queenslandica TaxID=400682 RepID=A0A1X7UAX6_AMPQE
MLRQSQTVSLVAQISSQLQDVVSSCKICCQHYSQRAEPLIPSELPQLPWQKVGMDLFDYKGSTYLLIIDYYSHYIEIAKLSKTTAGEVINHCKSIYARHGIPDMKVSDNRPLFAAESFKEFAQATTLIM